MSLSRKIIFFLLTLSVFSPITHGQNDNSLVLPPNLDDFTIEEFEKSDEKYLRITALDEYEDVDISVAGNYFFIIDKGDVQEIRFINGKGTVPFDGSGKTIQVRHVKPATPDHTKITELKSILFNRKGGNQIPLWLSILPPLLAIFFALIFKEVIISLVGGIWLGAFIVYGFDPMYFFHSIFDVVNHFIINALTDKGHLSVILFSLLIGGLVAIISRNGGMAGIVKHLARYANSAKNTQFVTWLLGIAVFFDDYANTLIVGNTMRPISDRFKISREKLAWIVDSTAAPVSAIAFITTWIGAELGYIDQATESLGINYSAYSIFIQSLKYAYYPILTLFFIWLIIRLQKDYGPMHKAEVRARTEGILTKVDSNNPEGDGEDLSPVKGIRYHWYNAAIPVMTLVAVTLIGLLYTGFESLGIEIATRNGGILNTNWSAIWGNLHLLPNPPGGILSKCGAIIGAADSYTALLWASSSAVIVAIILSVTTKTLSFKKSMETLVDGFKSMLPALIILSLAWALADVTKVLHTADFITGEFQGNISPIYMPFITFILAAIISFSTGSSWNTMAILYPIALQTTWILAIDSGMSKPEAMEIFFNVTACVLSGSVFGDHCSPISDTTILSSMATGCNHIDHVRTQLPYAMTVGIVAILVGGFLINFIPWYLCYLIGMAGLFFFVRYVGRMTPS